MESLELGQKTCAHLPPTSTAYERPLLDPPVSHPRSQHPARQGLFFWEADRGTSFHFFPVRNPHLYGSDSSLLLAFHILLWGSSIIVPYQSRNKGKAHSPHVSTPTISQTFRRACLQTAKKLLAQTGIELNLLQKSSLSRLLGEVEEAGSY